MVVSELSLSESLFFVSFVGESDEAAVASPPADSDTADPSASLSWLGEGWSLTLALVDSFWTSSLGPASWLSLLFCSSSLPYSLSLESDLSESSESLWSSPLYASTEISSIPTKQTCRTNVTRMLAYKSGCRETSTRTIVISTKLSTMLHQIQIHISKCAVFILTLTLPNIKHSNSQFFFNAWTLLTQLCFAVLNCFVQVELETAFDLSFWRGEDWCGSLFLLN